MGDEWFRELEARKHRLSTRVQRLLDDGDVIRATGRYFREAVFLSTEEKQAVAITYVALCHITPRTDTIDFAPYLGAHGGPGAGKSVFGRVMAALGGGFVSGGRSAAMLFRWLDANFGRLFVADEGEALLRGQRRHDFEEILLNGNDPEATIGRAVSGPNDAYRSYKIYGPKMLISVRGAEVSTALARRIITLDMQEPSVDEFSSLRVRAVEQMVCDALDEWATANVDGIARRYTYYQHNATYGPGRAFVNQAQRQVWAGMLAVADVAGISDPVAAYCQVHEQQSRLRIELRLRDALTGLLDVLPSGKYHYTDLRARLQERHGDRADRWSEERIGWVVKRVPHARVVLTDKDNQGRYVVVGQQSALATRPGSNPRAVAGGVGSGAPITLPEVGSDSVTV